MKYHQRSGGEPVLVYMQMIDSEAEKTKFEEIYEVYRSMMLSRAYDILKNHHDAEDAVQQAFITVAKNISKIEEVKCPKTKFFIVTITENKAIDLYRKKTRWAAVPYEDMAAPVEGGGDDLEKCIRMLPVRYRQVLLLRYVYGFNWQEIGQMLDITAANARKIGYRAREKLETICKEAGIL